MNINKSAIGLCLSTVLFSNAALASNVYYKYVSDEQKGNFTFNSEYEIDSLLGVNWDILGSQKFQLGFERGIVRDKLTPDLTRDSFKYSLRYKDIIFNTAFDQKFTYAEFNTESSSLDNEYLESRTVISKNTSFTRWYKLFVEVDYKFKMIDELSEKRNGTDETRWYNDELLTVELKNTFRLNKKNNLSISYFDEFETKDGLNRSYLYLWENSSEIRTKLEHQVGNRKSGLFKINARYERVLKGKRKSGTHEMDYWNANKYIMELDYTAPEFKFRLRPYWQKSFRTYIGNDTYKEDTRYGIKFDYNLTDEMKLIGHVYEQVVDSTRTDGLDPLHFDRTYLDLKLNYTF